MKLKLFFILFFITILGIIFSQNKTTENDVFDNLFIDNHFKVDEKFYIPICECNINGENAERKLNDHEIEHYTGFSLCYREKYEQAEWVAYKLTRDDLVKKVNRSRKFIQDYNISTDSATTDDYRDSGYDRGHLVPAGDMVRSFVTMKDSFRMSNVSPQHPKLNQGLWVKAEEHVRNWAHWYGTVYVITGPILEKEPDEYERIGYNKVVVPEYFYKIMLAPKLKNGKQIGWNSFAIIMENRNLGGKLKDYEVSIDEIEMRTGLDFFSLLDDKTENEIESYISQKK
ncbi:MAG: DNA/RNA non-specific endonuclease [Treponema sp.]|nr:DNA/RNA non-specific endonuclease [Treponema sp.]